MPLKKNIPQWISGKPPLSYLISRKIYDILIGNYTEDDLKGFSKKSLEVIDKSVKEAQKSGFAEGILLFFSISSDTV